MININSLQKIFIDAYSPKHGLLGILACSQNSLKRNIEHTSFYTTKENKWGLVELNFDTRSVVQIINDGLPTWCLLGKNGEVAEIRNGVAHIELIPGAGLRTGELGYMSKITAIDGNLYACGDSRQVYRRVDRKWINIADNILAKPEDFTAGFHSMDANSTNDIYCVGPEGQVFHYNGSTWINCSPPTNLGFNEVKCVSKDEVWIIGNKGNAFRGNKSKWYPVLLKENEDFKGIDIFNSNIYISSSTNIYKIDNNQKLEKVNFGINRQVSTLRLRAKDGLLWSIGNYDIFFFDGKAWTELIYPDNEKKN